MGLRLDTDVSWKLNSDFAELSEDGFCPLCNDFHNDCFCEAFWIRMVQQYKRGWKSNYKLTAEAEALAKEVKLHLGCQGETWDENNKKIRWGTDLESALARWEKFKNEGGEG
jgi:hypothetical protein